MQGDFSRLRFDSLKGYSRVLMQQGRVMLDADWNEQSAILLHLMRAFGADLIGPHGGPEANLGFGIRLTSDEEDLEISPGYYYVDGILCELRGANEAGAVKPATYLGQADYFYPHAKALPAPPYLVYLDVWERHVTGLEDAELLEVALGGPDTATRAQVVWQVKVLSQEKLPKGIDLTGTTCADFPLGDFRRFLQGNNRGQLKARARRPEQQDDPCVTEPEARFRGNENQLYRVEIHRTRAWTQAELDDWKKATADALEGKKPLPPIPADLATFKWSRENGSVVARWLETRGDELLVSGMRDRARGFQAGDWVELTDDDRDLRGELGVRVVQLARVEGDLLSVSLPAGETLPDPSGKRSKVRRWDQRGTKKVKLVGGVVPLEEGGWLELEDGVQIQFQSSADVNEPNRYRTGDYWLIPARVATGDVLWPGDPEAPQALPPHGVAHHYAPLLLVQEADTKDLRRKFGASAKCS